ncbi:hypothetical protein BDP55DRAFT_560752, partial [Colletotrichum godetiae]
RSGSHRHGRKGEKKDREHKSREPSRKQEVPLSYFSFLFVVNEFRIFEGGVVGDPLGNTRPPNSADGYDEEKAGKVWRYQNGSIDLAAGYQWSRPLPGSPGIIRGPVPEVDEFGNYVFVDREMEVYKTYSVFNCWRFLPCVFYNGDVSTVDDARVEGWQTLIFTPGQMDLALTRIGCFDFDNAATRHVVGRNPSWMPHLLPYTFSTSNAAAPQSTGLGGNLSIIIALMALAREPGDTDRVFREKLWDMGILRGSRSSRAGEYLVDFPRGVMVQICCDSFNTNSTPDTILDFEIRGCAVYG